MKDKDVQAFPRQQWEYDGQNNVLHYQEGGMTLRDYFAAKALNGILSDPNAGLLEDDLSRYANIAYKAADAMLKARG